MIVAGVDVRGGDCVFEVCLVLRSARVIRPLADIEDILRIATRERIFSWPTREPDRIGVEVDRGRAADFRVVSLGIGVDLAPVVTGCEYDRIGTAGVAVDLEKCA